MEWLTPVVVAILAAAFSGLMTYFIATRNAESKMENIAEVESDKAVKNHVKINHQDSLYTYVEGALEKHKVDCGSKTTAAISKLESKMHHMELKDVRNTTILEGVAKTVSRIAEKMNISEIDIPRDIDS